jgi:hypothetical protein
MATHRLARSPNRVVLLCGKMKTDSEPNFARSYWNGYEVLSWIAYRNADRLGTFNELKLLKFSKVRWRREEPYPLRRKNADPSHPGYWDADLIESPWAGTIEADYEGSLLNALRDGAIPAYRNGEKLKREFWWGKSPTAEEWANYHFSSAKVRDYWKEDCPGDPQLAVKHIKLLKAPKKRLRHDFIARGLEVAELPPVVATKVRKNLSGFSVKTGTERQEDATWQPYTGHHPLP